MAKKKLLLCDLVIAKNICNAECEYCLTRYDHFTSEDRNVLKNKYAYQKGNPLHTHLNDIVCTLLDHFEVAALKISGGEILLIPGIIQFLREQSSEFINVQMMTNGTLLNEARINALSSIPNFHLQISIDSHDLRGNIYRNKSKAVQNRLLQNIDMVIGMGIPLEINCVLTDKSLAYLEDFLNYLLQYQGSKLVVFPFPVRGNEIERFFPKDEQLCFLERIMNNYDRYKAILPPYQYMQGLYQFIRNHERTQVCSVPYHSFQIFDDGQCTPCPYWWTVDLGNVLSHKVNALDKIQTDPIYRLLLSRKHKLQDCKHCYVRAEILNMYFDNTISMETLKKISFYSDERMTNFLECIKSSYDDYIFKHIIKNLD